MYAPHFGLRQAPFSIAPDPRALFLSERHREALAHLLYGLQGGGGVVVLSGAIGAGKTTLCHAFLAQVPAGTALAYIFNPPGTVAELLAGVCEEFGLGVPPDPNSPLWQKACIDRLNQFLLATHASGQQALLVVDEAQHLGPAVLEALRLLTNLETPERKLLQIILIGQPELREQLAQPGLAQLNQRVIARCHLDPLDPHETLAYVQHRLAVAGREGPLPFEPAALRALHALSGGVPRRINLLCDRALLGAWTQGQAQVSLSVLRRAAAEVFDPPASPRHGAVVAAVAVMAAVAPWAGASLLAAVGWWVWVAQQGPDPARPAVAATPAASAQAGAGPAASASAASSAASSAVLAVAMPAASAAASSPASTPALADPPPRPSRLAAQAQGAWPALGQAWQLTLADEPPLAACVAFNDPTDRSDRNNTPPACHRATQGSWPLLRQLDRPVLLALYLPDSDAPGAPPGTRPHWLLLQGLAADGQVLLGGGATALHVPWDTLAPWWKGEWLTLWRPPAHHAQRHQQPQAWQDRLATLLAQWQGQRAPAPADTRSAARVADQLRHFQASVGLQPDGLAGPITLMALNQQLPPRWRAAEPRLLPPPWPTAQAAAGVSPVNPAGTPP